MMDRSDNNPILTSSGRKTRIVGHQVCQIRFSASGAAVCMTFCGPYDRLSEIRFEGEIILKRGNSETILTGAKGGVTYNPRELYPLVDLLGAQVTGVQIVKQELVLAFSNNRELRARADEFDYPSWTIRDQGVSLL
jgi:hypothetical protein